MDSSTLHVSILQSKLYWQDPEKNIQHFSNQIEKTKQQTDLIILPEMFTTGFTMDVKANADDQGRNALAQMIKWAKEKNAAICGSVIVEELGKYYNRLYFVKPDGHYSTYDKRHLFRMADEHNFFSQGEERVIINYKGWNICPMVCYDLRFPVWSRNVNLEYDLLLYVANWPKVRSSAWSTLLQARAIENVSYAVGVNRIGEDDNGIAYSGNSAVIDYKGEVIVTQHDDEALLEATLSKNDLAKFRDKFPAHKDADDFTIE